MFFKATSICFCILPCITFLASIIVNAVYDASLLIEMEMVLMKPAIMNECRYTHPTFSKRKVKSRE